MADVPKEIYVAFQKMKAKDYAASELILTQGLEKADQERENTHQALYHSTLGVLYKVKGDFKEAWRHYEKAEKLLPDDPSLKIISAKLLIDQFAQYDSAIKKMRRVLKIAKGASVYEHQAYAILATAHLKKGEKKKAAEMLKNAMVDDFQQLGSAQNINLEVIEIFLSRNWETDLCRNYLEKGRQLAQQRGEEKVTLFFQRLLEGFQTDFAAP